MVKVWLQILSSAHMLAITYGIFYLSAGGLATYLHVDYFRSRIPSNIPVHAISDAGYVCISIHTHTHTYPHACTTYTNTQRISQLS